MLTHFTSVAPVQFFLNPVQVTQLQTFLFSSADLPFHWIMVSTFFCVFILVSCAIIKPIGLLPEGPTFKHEWAKAFFSMHVKSCDVTSSRHFSRARVSSTAARVLSLAAWWTKRRRTRKQHSCACHRDAIAQFVLQRLHKIRPSTTVYDKACTKYFPVLYFVLQSLHKVFEYYCVRQSLHKVLPSTT